MTLYRACKRAGRTLVLDLYTVGVLERLSAFRDTLPRLGWPALRAVVTRRMKWLYDSPERLNDPGFVERCATSGHAIGAAKLVDERDVVVMLRPSLLRDYMDKGVALTPDDAWVFSMWSGYLDHDTYREVRDAFRAAGAASLQIHTSGHASRDDLLQFAARVAPAHLVPIHSFDWDEHVGAFDNVRRLRDGEAFVIPRGGAGVEPGGA